MIIERLVKKNEYVYINFDNGGKERIHYEIAVNFGLRKNDEIDDKKLRDILEAEEEFSLKNSALRYLSNRPHSSFELRSKLRKKGYSLQKISRVISDLKQKNYLSDSLFAERYIEENLSKKKGLNKIKAELMNKGVERVIIDSELSKINADDRLKQNAFELAEKKIKVLQRKELNNLQLKQKLYGYLNTKGYSFDIIREVVDDLLAE